MIQIPIVKHNFFALIDDEDWPKVGHIRWNLSEGYAYWCNGREYMHNIILPPVLGFRVDHIKNEERLNNQKSNLRLATDSQNGFNRGLNANNTSGFKGVTYCNTRQLYQAKISVKGKTIHLGRYSTSVEAAMAYNKAAKELIGEYAYLNPV